jgi:hypothetical protein
MNILKQMEDAARQAWEGTRMDQGQAMSISNLCDELVELGIPIPAPVGRDWSHREAEDYIESLLRMRGMKKLTDLEDEINSGKTAWAQMDKQGGVGVWLHSPGHYIYELEFCGLHVRFMSDEMDNHTTLQSFLDSIEWDEADEYHCEMRAYLLLTIWYTEDHQGDWLA